MHGLRLPRTNFFFRVFCLQEDLNDGLPWDVLDAQGSYNTIYVASFASHENVNSIYEYGNLLSNTTQVPRRRTIARIADVRNVRV